MKSRPILFSAPMVRAILAGQKTQTRRIVKPQPPCEGFRLGTCLSSTNRSEEGKHRWIKEDIFSDHKNPNKSFRFPFGRPGDRLWVKETWRTTRGLDHCKPTGLAEGAPIQFDADQWRPGFGLQEPGKTRVSLFMRRWMSRITLEIESVRVERLQDITEGDAMAEGVIEVPKKFGTGARFWRDYRLSGDGTFCVLTPRESYRSLWDSINGAGAWDLNPWVWVISFRRITR